MFGTTKLYCMSLPFFTVYSNMNLCYKNHNEDHNEPITLYDTTGHVSEIVGK